MQRERGLTLLELLITLAIAGLLLVVGLPSLSHLLRDNTLTFESTQLLKQFRFARAQAIDGRTRVTLCLLTTGNACSQTGSRLVVFVDANNDGALNAGETLLTELQAYDGELAVSSNQTRYRFDPDGTAMGFSGTVTLCMPGQQQVAVILAASGRVRQQTNATVCG